MSSLHQARQHNKQLNAGASRSRWIWLFGAGIAMLIVGTAFVVFGGALPRAAQNVAAVQAPDDAQGAQGTGGHDDAAALAALTSAEPTATPEPTSTPEPTATPEPTNTPEPTSTPEPTNTPEPTSTPEPTLTPVPTAIPLPPPVVIEGEGTTVTGPIEFPSPINLAVISYDGADAFIVTWVEPTGEDELLTSGGGPYSGQHLVSGYGEHSFAVIATGRWRIEIQPLAHCEDPTPTPEPILEPAT